MIVQNQKTTFDRFFQSVARIGQKYIPSIVKAHNDAGTGLTSIAMQVLGCRGESTKSELIVDLISEYENASDEKTLAFFEDLAHAFGPFEIEGFDNSTSATNSNYMALKKALKSRRQMLFQAISEAPLGIAFLVKLRSDLGRYLQHNADLKPLDFDLKNLFECWFTRGLLELRRIDWNTSANILSKLQKYEAVHPIEGWDDLQRRLMTDRRCFAFFHPALPDEPLIFIQVALTREYCSNIQQILGQQNVLNNVGDADHAIFYSISNCQDGLRGISFGGFLIKQVSEQLKTELPNLLTFATLSPLPGFRQWLECDDVETDEGLISRTCESEQLSEADHLVLGRLAADYLTQFKQGVLLDPVARFHLGNGAILDRINLRANQSEQGLAQSFGVMVNYRYEIGKLEQNHEKLHQSNEIATSPLVAKLLKRR